MPDKGTYQAYAVQLGRRLSVPTAPLSDCGDIPPEPTGRVQADRTANCRWSWRGI